MRLLQDPRQKHFRVTRKGISRKQITFEADIAWPIIAFLFLYIAALVYGFYNARWRASGDVFVLMVIWCIFRIIVLWTTLQVAINLPQERKTTRFKHKLDCLVYHDREVYNGKTLDVSDGGIRVDLDRLPRFWTTGGLVKLDIPEINISGIPAFIRRYDKGRQVSFNYGGISIQQKRQLVSFLYCEDGRWSKMGLSSMRAVIVMFKSIFRIYPIENSRRSSV